MGEVVVTASAVDAIIAALSKDKVTQAADAGTAWHSSGGHGRH